MQKMVIATLLLMTSFAWAALTEKTIEYKIGSDSFEGFLVYDAAKGGKQPGVLVVHDWLGLTDKTKEKARDFAKLGYVAFAADIYGKGVRPSGQDDAGKLATTYKSDRAKYRAHLNAALDTLKKQSNVDTKRLAAAGYCFGGTGVIELARSGADLKAVVSFHGGLDSPTPADGKNIKAHVLALHGADDPFEKPEDLTAFENEMRTNKVDWQLVKFGGAVHSFTDKTAGTDNSKGAAYNAVADKRSWQDMKDFFGQVL
jgi:dienelactone hydrolase